jgi:hypothetical protein
MLPFRSLPLALANGLIKMKRFGFSQTLPRVLFG